MKSSEAAIMIRKATACDIDRIEAAYDEHFEYEREHGAFTVFRKGVYPTRETAVNALNAGTLYVYEDEGGVQGSVIIDGRQAEEYKNIEWGKKLDAGKVKVVHLLMVRPSAAKRGIASALMRFAEELARGHSCEALRLDTGAQNIPAVSLYKKLGYRVVASADMKVGGAVAHQGHLFLEKLL